MTVRPAKLADAPAITGIWNHAIRETLVTFNSVQKTEEDIAAMIAAKAAAGEGFFVAESGGAVAGFATWGPFRGGIGYRHTAEHSILLTEAVQGQGLGRALMKAIEEHAAKAEIHSLFAGVSSANPAGRAFHAALGYREIATLREVGRKWDRWLDLHLMQKFLSGDRASH
ncbi:MAG: GNAT family N-acetyltransferase [Alphaproteobacteria bacterium]|nr:GNAT family N-acetyltransferase [Alphaproteobacteria bacterium]